MMMRPLRENGYNSLILGGIDEMVTLVGKHCFAASRLNAQSSMVVSNEEIGAKACS